MRNSPAGRGQDPYGDNHYFAFVESSEALDPMMVKGGGEPAEWSPVLDIRKGMGLGPPTAVMWLDCVSANYFAALEWKNEECEIGNREDADRRRKLLLQLDSRQFKVAMLPIDPAGKGGERDDFGRFNEMSWHLVKLSQKGGLPVLAGPDFDLDADQREILFVKHERFLDKSEQKSIGNVFSLNFLPDADLNGRERPNGNTPPRDKPPGSGLTELKIIDPYSDVEYREESRYHRLNER